MSRDRNYTNDPAADDYEGNDPYADRYADADEPYGNVGEDDDGQYGGLLPYGGVSAPGGTRLWSDDDDGGADYGRGGDDTAVMEDTLLDEGIISLLILVGVVLVLFPEPATSTIGAVMVVLGVGAMIVDWILQL